MCTILSCTEKPDKANEIENFGLFHQGINYLNRFLNYIFTGEPCLGKPNEMENVL